MTALDVQAGKLPTDGQPQEERRAEPPVGKSLLALQQAIIDGDPRAADRAERLVAR